MRVPFREIIEDCPVIATAKNDDDLERALKTESNIVFLLYGDVCSIASTVERVKEEGKVAMVHLDLIAGLDAKEVAVDYMKNMTKADGIISTKTAQINRAKELGLYTVHRFFVLDSRSLENMRKQCMVTRPDCIEILPGVMPKIISKVASEHHVPIIAGGLIADKDDVMTALKAGATAISTTRQELWEI